MPPGFTRVFREELARVDERQVCCRLATVAGLVHTAGTFLIRGGASEEERYEVRLSTPLQVAAKLVYQHFKSLGAGGELVTRREPRFQRRLVYEVHLKGSPPVLQALNEMGALTDSFQLFVGIPRRLARRPCCRRAFVRGCLIGGGSANAPQKEAHLELVVSNGGFAADLAHLLAELNFHPGLMERRGSHVVYLKGRDEVAGLLAWTGAHESALMVEEQAVVKEVRARANRLANCDAANLRRTTTAAACQLEAIETLEQSGQLGQMPRALQEAAYLRVRYPYMTLRELAESEGSGLSRSALNHRLRRLVRAAEQAGREGVSDRIRFR